MSRVFLFGVRTFAKSKVCGHSRRRLTELAPTPYSLSEHHKIVKIATKIRKESMFASQKMTADKSKGRAMDLVYIRFSVSGPYNMSGVSYYCPCSGSPAFQYRYITRAFVAYKNSARIYSRIRRKPTEQAPSRRVGRTARLGCISKRQCRPD